MGRVLANLEETLPSREGAGLRPHLLDEIKQACCHFFRLVQRYDDPSNNDAINRPYACDKVGKSRFQGDVNVSVQKKPAHGVIREDVGPTAVVQRIDRRERIIFHVAPVNCATAQSISLSGN